MKKENKIYIDPDMLGEYDLSNGVRGKYARTTGPKSKVVVHDQPEMRELFPAFYAQTEQEIASLWQDCVFAFDANVLLHIYKYTPETKKEFLNVLKKLQERIWLPHQAAYEYQKRRLVVIDQQRQAYGEIEKILKQAVQSLESALNPYAKHPSIDVQPMLQEIKAVVEREKQRLKIAKETHPDYSAVDELRDTVSEYFRQRIGEPYTEDELEAIYRKADQRIQQQVPPGYKDAPRHGDIIIWFQLLDYARVYQRPIIFVTDDAKEDWWLRDNSLTPRPELVQEMHDNAHLPFHMYLADKFLEEAKTYLKLQDKKGTIADAIEEVREVRQQEEVAEASEHASIGSSTRIQQALQEALVAQETYQAKIQQALAEERAYQSSISDSLARRLAKPQDYSTLINGLTQSGSVKRINEEITQSPSQLSSSEQLAKLASQNPAGLHSPETIIIGSGQASDQTVAFMDRPADDPFMDQSGEELEAEDANKG